MFEGVQATWILWFSTLNPQHTLKNKKVFRFGVYEPVSPVKAHAVDPTIARESPLTPYSQSLGEVL